MNLRQQIVEQAKKEATDRGKLVFMGNGTIVAVPGTLNQIYVTDPNGHVEIVWNLIGAQNVLNHPAWIKLIDKKLQVTELWDVYPNFAYSKVPPHWASHYWKTGTDIVPIE